MTLILFSETLGICIKIAKRAGVTGSAYVIHHRFIFDIATCFGVVPKLLTSVLPMEKCGKNVFPGEGATSSAIGADFGRVPLHSGVVPNDDSLFPNSVVWRYWSCESFYAGGLRL